MLVFSRRKIEDGKVDDCRVKGWNELGGDEKVVIGDG